MSAEISRSFTFGLHSGEGGEVRGHRGVDRLANQRNLAGVFVVRSDEIIGFTS
jgi:hypothetical protein